ALAQFEIVLKVDAKQGFSQTPVAVRARWRRVKLNGDAGEKARNIQKRVVPSAVGTGDLVVLNSPEIRTHLDGMFPLDVREIITFLEQVPPIDSGRSVVDPDEIQRAA